MLTVSCKDITSNCEFVGRAHTEDDLMMQVVGHLVRKHDIKVEEVMTAEMREKIREQSKLQM